MWPNSNKFAPMCMVQQRMYMHNPKPLRMQLFFQANIPPIALLPCHLYKESWPGNLVMNTVWKITCIQLLCAVIKWWHSDCCCQACEVGRLFLPLYMAWEQGKQVLLHIWNCRRSACTCNEPIYSVTPQMKHPRGTGSCNCSTSSVYPCHESLEMSIGVCSIWALGQRIIHPSLSWPNNR